MYKHNMQHLKESQAEYERDKAEFIDKTMRELKQGKCKNTKVDDRKNSKGFAKKALRRRKKQPMNILKT